MTVDCKRRDIHATSRDTHDACVKLATDGSSGRGSSSGDAAVAAWRSLAIKSIAMFFARPLAYQRLPMNAVIRTKAGSRGTASPNGFHWTHRILRPIHPWIPLTFMSLSPKRVATHVDVLVGGSGVERWKSCAAASGSRPPSQKTTHYVKALMWLTDSGRLSYKDWRTAAVGSSSSSSNELNPNRLLNRGWSAAGRPVKRGGPPAGVASTRTTNK